MAYLGISGRDTSNTRSVQGIVHGSLNSVAHRGRAQVVCLRLPGNLQTPELYNPSAGDDRALNATLRNYKQTSDEAIATVHLKPIEIIKKKIDLRMLQTGMTTIGPSIPTSMIEKIVWWLKIP